MADPRPPLFSEFPPVSTEDWEAQIAREIGSGSDALVWEMDEGVLLRPFYRREDLGGLAHLNTSRAPVELGSRWVIQQNLSTPDLNLAAEHVRNAVEGGVECIGLEMHVDEHAMRGVPIQAAGDLGRVLAAVPLPDTAIHLEAGPLSPAFLAMLLTEAERRGVSTSDLRGTLGFDPLADLAAHGRLTKRAFEMAAQLVAETRGTAFRPLRAGGSVYHDCGATIVQETGLALAAISEYLVRCSEFGASAADVARALYVSVSVSTSYLPEIARLRALRLLIPQVLEGFLEDAEATQLPIHAETSRRQMTCFDPASNLLRATTQAASAVLGGCDVLVVHPFNALQRQPDAFGLRLARNLQLILRHEAHLDAVADPAAGSYSLETLTDAIARRSWEVFQQIEAQGGLIESLKSGMVQRWLTRSRERLRHEAATGRRGIVGTNLYPDPEEPLPDRPKDQSTPLIRTDTECPYEWRAVRTHIASGGVPGDLMIRSDALAEPLVRFRESEPFEAIRIKMLQLPEAPKVLVLPIGEPVVRSRRAEMAADVLHAAGLHATVPSGFDEVEQALAYPEEAVDLLVIAAPDGWCGADEVHQLRAAYNPRLLGTVSSDEDTLDVDFRISAQEDIIDFARQLLEGLTAGTEA